MPHTPKPTRPARKTRRPGSVWSLLAAVLALSAMLVGPDLQTAAEANRGRAGSTASTGSTGRAASPTTTRRPRAGAIRTTRAAPARPNSVVSANIAGRVQRAASPRQNQSTQRSSTPRESITRPRTNRGSVTGNNARANARRNSAQSITAGYRPADPAPLRTGNPGSPGTAPGRANSVESATSLDSRVTRLERQVEQLRSSVALVEVSAYNNGWMAGQAYTMAVVNRAAIHSRP